MDKKLLYYDYDAALRHFEERLLKIKQGSLKRSCLKIVAKPVLLLSVLKAIDSGRITCNRIEYDDVKPIYEGTFRTFFLKARQENLTPMYYPWYYMKTYEFWKLTWKCEEMATSESMRMPALWLNSTYSLLLLVDMSVVMTYPESNIVLTSI